MQQQSRPCITLREAAERLGTSISSIRRRIREGNLHAELVPGQFGDRWEIPLDILETIEGAPNEKGAGSRSARSQTPWRSSGGPPEDLHGKALNPQTEQVSGSLAETKHTFDMQATRAHGAPPEGLHHGVSPGYASPGKALASEARQDSMEGVHGVPPEELRRDSMNSRTFCEVGVSPHQDDPYLDSMDSMDGLNGGAPEVLQGIPVSVYMETLRQLEEANIRALQAREARDAAVDDARRLDRQVVAMQFEIGGYRRALTEHAESLAQREVQARETELRLVAAEREMIEETARRQTLEEEITATRLAPPPRNFWQRVWELANRKL